MPKKVIIRGAGVYARQTYGMSQEQRIGNISASSTTFTITGPADPSGLYSTFLIGDHVIVEIGGEAGGGLRDTDGVGGTFDATGLDANDYYFGTAKVPLALLTTVTAVSANGQILTLEDTASVAATSATIYFDNWFQLQPLLSIAGWESNTIDIPAGRFAMSSGLTNAGWDPLQDFGPPHLLDYAPYIDDLTSWTIQGQGKEETVLFAPRGARGSGMHLDNFTTGIIRDFTIIGNFRLNGYNSENLGGFSFSPGLRIDGFNNAVSNVRVEDVWVNAIHFSGGSFSTATDCEYVATEQVRKYYANWYFGCSDSEDHTFTRCNVTSSHVVWGYETFRSRRTQFIDCTSVNGSFASNSSGDWELTNFNLTVTSQTNLPLFNGHSLGGWSTVNYLIDVNNNIGGGFVADGGTVSGGTINVEGYTWAENIPQVAAPRSIHIASANPDILVEDMVITYDVSEANAIKSEASVNTVIQNVTVVGTFNVNTNPFNNIQVINGAVTNCTAGLILCTGPACVLT